MRCRWLSWLVAAAAVLALAGPARAGGLRAQSIQALQLAEQRMQATAVGLAPTAYPYYTDASGSWVTTGASAWTSGFFPGSLWLLDRATGAPAWASEAETWQAGIEGQDTNTGTGDLGFMLFDSFGNGFEQTRDSAFRQVVLTAAASLASRYSPVVGAVRSWGSADDQQFTVIVDNLMNLELLLWAGEHGGPRSDTQIALTDALTTERDFVRPDGSTIHIVNYDPATGAIESTSDNGTTWARGQAWAIHGFTTVYAYTHDPRMLSAAEQVANWWVANVPADGVPYSNFEPADPATAPLDSSAAAIAASGLIQLAHLVNDASLRATYLTAARTALTTLTSPAFLSSGTDNAAVLLHGTDNLGAGIVDTGLSYGDYYLLEGLLRLDPDLGRQAAKAGKAEKGGQAEKGGKPGKGAKAGKARARVRVR